MPVVRAARRDRVPLRRSGGAELSGGPDALSDEEWADYLFMRDNPKGPFRERWFHSAGCRRWFNAVRDTATHRFSRRTGSTRSRRRDGTTTSGRWLPDRPVEAARVHVRRSRVTGFEGDTLASALLANGVDVVCRSPILGRPRGIVSAGAEEPSAFVEVSEPWFDPIVAATMVELVDGLIASGRRGSGFCRRRAEASRATPACPRRDLGRRGRRRWLPAAEEAAGRGDRVLLVEREPRLASGAPVGVTILTTRPRSACTTTATWSCTSADPTRHLWHVRAGRVVLATGAHERPIAFADNDRPGVMLAGAVARYVRDFGVLPGERAVVFTTNDSRARSPRRCPRPAPRSPSLPTSGTGGPSRARMANERVRRGPRETAPMASDAPSSATCSPSRADGTPQRSSGARSAATSVRRETRACFVPDGTGPAWL